MNFENITISDNGKILNNGIELTNEELLNYFINDNYPNPTEKEYVKGIFSNNIININGTKYPTKLDEEGNLISVDNKNVLNKEQLESFLGKKGYHALICKTNSNVTIVDDKFIFNDSSDTNINDNDNKDDNENSDNDNKENDENKNIDNKHDNDENKNTDNKQDNNSKSNNVVNNNNSTKSKASSPSSNTSSNISSNTSSDTSYTPTVKQNVKQNNNIDTKNNSNIKKEEPYEFKTKTGNNNIIKFNYEEIESIITQLKEEKTNIDDKFEEYKTSISNFEKDDEELKGIDKDAEVVNIKSYYDCLTAVSETYDNFINSLIKCKDQYNEVEKNIIKLFE